MTALWYLLIHPNDPFSSQIECPRFELILRPLILQVHQLSRYKPILLRNGQQVIQIVIQLNRNSTHILIIHNGSTPEDIGLAHCPNNIISG